MSGMDALGKYWNFIDPLHIFPGHNTQKPKMAPISTPSVLDPATSASGANAGQKAELIATSPQGVLDPATTSRKTLLGG